MAKCIALIALMLAAASCLSCSPISEQSESRSDGASADLTPSERASSDGQDEGETELVDTPITYPTGWLIVPAGDIPVGVAVNIEHLPAMDVVAHQGGEAMVDGTAGADAVDDEGLAVVSLNGQRVSVNPDTLLVNLPDIVGDAEYDVVYSYASTSRLAGKEIPGITGQRLDGYVDGKQENAYLGAREYVVPCAYATAVKVRQVADMLLQRGYKLLVYDAYRPMTAQLQLSELFAAACDADPDIQAANAGWGTDWYVASGASGHNFGTDLDVGVADGDGTPLPMPSSFDAFDESGHLTMYPMTSGEITPDDYRTEVIENDACMALHEAFTAAGFSELASEWWHFGDEETEWRIRSLVGDAGLDFAAEL